MFNDFFSELTNRLISLLKKSSAYFILLLIQIIPLDKDCLWLC